MTPPLVIRRIGLDHGPALVLIHGWALHSGVFSTLISHLSPYFQIYVVDLPGYGVNHSSSALPSFSATTAAIAAHTPPAIWCGWSLGGLLALQAASCFPQHVQRLIMLSATPRFVQAEDWPWATSAKQILAFYHGLETDSARTLSRFMMLNVQGSAYARQRARELQALITHSPLPTLAVLQQGLNWLHTQDLRATLSTLALPTLWLGGTHDPLIPPAALHAAAKLATGNQQDVVIFADSSHVPFLDHPDTVARLIHDFIYA